jgi:hypothetical protein
MSGWPPNRNCSGTFQTSSWAPTAAPLYVDQEVLQHETVVFAAGSQTESVQLKTADLLQHEQATALPLTKHADENDKD